MINGLIAIFGTMLGFACGYIFRQMRKTEDKAPDMASPIIAEKRLEVETLNAKCDFPKSLILGSEEENRDTILKSLSYDIADQIYKERSKYIEYTVEEDYCMNRLVAHGALRVVKNT